MKLFKSKQYDVSYDFMDQMVSWLYIMILQR
jgi:hypothetical protein